MSGEPLPEWWVVAGTTGYDFLGSVNGLFVDRGTSRRMTAIYPRFAGADSAMADQTYAAKRLIMQVSMASEINQLGHHLDRISERNRLFRDFTLPSLARALREVIAAFPVYRTYVGDDGGEPSARDRAYIEHAVAEAERRNPTGQRLRLRLRPRRAAPALPRGRRRRGAGGAAPLRHALSADHRPRHGQGRRGHRALPLQPARVAERGGQRSRPLRRAHRRLSRQERPPAGALAGHAPGTATHDTKRGEDVRARINVLSEVPERVGRGGAALARDRPPLQARGRRTGRARPERRVPALPDARRRLAPARCRRAARGVHRPHPRLHGEGDQGSQGPHELGQSQSPPTTTRCGDSSRACSRRAVRFIDASRPFRRGRRALRRRQLAGADAAQDRRPGHPRLLPGLRALGSLAGRPRQSTSGRLRAAAVGARRPRRAHRRRVARLERARGRAPRGLAGRAW